VLIVNQVTVILQARYALFPRLLSFHNFYNIDILKLNIDTFTTVISGMHCSHQDCFFFVILRVHGALTIGYKVTANERTDKNCDTLIRCHTPQRTSAGCLSPFLWQFSL